MMRTRSEGETAHGSTESVHDHLDRLKQLYESLSVPQEDAHQYAYGVAPQGA